MAAPGQQPERDRRQGGVPWSCRSLLRHFPQFGARRAGSRQVAVAFLGTGPSSRSCTASRARSNRSLRQSHASRPCQRRPRRRRRSTCPLALAARGSRDGPADRARRPLSRPLRRWPAALAERRRRGWRRTRCEHRPGRARSTRVELLPETTSRSQSIESPSTSTPPRLPRLPLRRDAPAVLLAEVDDRGGLRRRRGRRSSAATDPRSSAPSRPQPVRRASAPSRGRGADRVRGASFREIVPGKSSGCSIAPVATTMRSARKRSSTLPASTGTSPPS